MRLMDGVLRIYAGTEEKLDALTAKEIFSFIMKRKDGYTYLRHCKKYGVWVCVNSINKKRRRIEAHEF